MSIFDDPDLKRTVDSEIKATPLGKQYAKWDGLQRYNLILCIIHIVLAIFLVFYFKRIRDPNKPVDFVNLDLYTHSLKFNKSTNIFEIFSKKALEVGERDITGLIVSFFVITASFHLLYALNPGNIYLDAVKNGNNWMRWVEYSLSATIMLIIIGLLSGVKDIQNYFVLITSAFAIMWTGQWFESSSGSMRWVPIIIGFVLLAGVFSVIFKSFSDRLKEAKDAGFKVPSWLYAVVIVLFIFYASFGFVPVAQILFKGDYRKYEYTYLTLSLVSKATLGLLVAIGFGQRSQASNPS